MKLIQRALISAGGFAIACFSFIPELATGAAVGNPALISATGNDIVLVADEDKKPKRRASSGQQMQKQIQQYLPGGIPVVIPGGLVEQYVGQGGYGGGYGGGNSGGGFNAGGGFNSGGGGGGWGGGGGNVPQRNEDGKVGGRH